MSPNGGVTQYIVTAKVKLPHVSKKARDTQIFSSLASGSLYFVGQLCDDGCEAYFDKNICTITKNGKLVLSGTCTANIQLWIADDIKSSNALYNDAATVIFFSQAAEPQTTINSSLAHAPSHAANNFCPEPHLAAHIAFFHATLFSPEISNFYSAIDAGLLHSLPGNTTSSLVRKHLFFSEAIPTPKSRHEPGTKIPSPTGRVSQQRPSAPHRSRRLNPTPPGKNLP